MRTLRDILKQPLDPNDIRAITTEMDGEKPRGLVLLGATLVEEVLRLLLISKMVPLSETEAHALFGPTQPLSSFASKINLGYAIGCYGKSTKHDLHKIREIRNAFAHARVLISFETNEVENACKNMHCVRRFASGTAQEHFAMAAKMLTLHLHWKYRPGEVRIPPGYEPMD